MTRTRGLLAVLAVALAGAGLLAQEPGLPPNPHEPLNSAAACPGCHSYWKNPLGKLEIMPGEFVGSIPEKCWVCHPQERLGRSHPIDVDPAESDPVVEVPEEIPLESGRVSCGSCHVPHGEQLSTARSFPKQEPFVTLGEGETEIHYYKTYFLRIPGDPVQGFTPLCHSCHPEF
jgi:hypothetical protein